MDKPTYDLLIKVKNEINENSSKIVDGLIVHAETVVAMYKELLNDSSKVDKKYTLTICAMSRSIIDASLKMMDALKIGTNLVNMGLKDINDEIEKIQKMDPCAEDIYKDERIEVVDEKDLYKKD